MFSSRVEEVGVNLLDSELKGVSRDLHSCAHSFW